MAVGLVTDSTAYLPESLTSALGIIVVPVQVIIDGVAYNETDSLTNANIAEAFAQGLIVTTSRPSPEQFVAAFSELVEHGCTEIVSVHLSSELSGTYESALLASARMDVPVHVVDSQTIGMAMGAAIESGAGLAADGASGAAVAAHIAARCEKSHMWFSVDTLEYLQRGGRIGAVQARIGGALSVKPILTMVNGQVESLELVRTTTKATARIAEIAAASATVDCDIAVHHVDAHERAEAIAQTLCEALGRSQITITPAGAVVGVHTGPGTVAVAMTPRI